MNLFSMKIFVNKIESGEPIMYHNIEMSKEETKRRFLNIFHKNGNQVYTKRRKQRKYPLWMLKLFYSRFTNPMFDLKRFTSKNWKDLVLVIDLDGDVILARRRFSKRNDKITIIVINDGCYFIILEKGVFYA